jgi:hypothetical protein
MVLEYWLNREKGKTKNFLNFGEKGLFPIPFDVKYFEIRA